MGHGVFDRASGEGMLAFEGTGGALDLVSGRAFATKIRDLRSLGVVVLNACNTARAGHQEGLSPFRGVSAALVLGGVPAVVAMQRPISDRAAIGFSDAFYRHLARGDSIDEALTEGRQAIHSTGPESFEWATPVLFLRIPEGNVFVARPAAEPVVAAAATATAPVQTAGAMASPVAAGQAPQMDAQAALAGPNHPPARENQAAAAGRRGTIFKIAVGAAGIGVLAGTLYFVLPKQSAPPVPGHDGLPTSSTDLSSSLTTGRTEPDPAYPRVKTESKPHLGSSHNDASGMQRQPPIGNQAKTQQGNGANTVTPVTPPVADHQAEAPAPTADLSSLSAQATIARRDNGGLRVTVSFRNSAGLSLSALLDTESAELSDDQGQRYQVVACDLPAKSSNRELNIPAGGSVTAHLDYGMPKLGSTTFRLSLATEDGHHIQIGGPPWTLGGPP
jgi:hypothetical protein